jgi:hypothetical protein
MDDSKGTLKNLLKEMREQNKTDLLLQTLQVKYNREVSGEDNDKREIQLDKANENLVNIERAILGNGDQLKVIPKNIADSLNVQLSKLSVPEEDKTFTESLKELVGGYKSFEQKVAGAFDKGFNFLSNPLKSMQDGLKNIAAKGKEKREKAGDYVRDVLNTPAGATAESIRFTKEYEKQNRQFAAGMTREEIAEGKLQAQGQKVFEQKVAAEKDVAAAEADIASSKKYGFAGTPEDVQRLEKAKEADKAAQASFVSRPGEEKLEKVEAKQTKNEEADNVISAQESMADSLKENNIIIKDLLDTTKEQLDTVKIIRDSLTPTENQEEDARNQKKEKFYNDVTGKLDEISGKLDNVGSGSLLGSAVEAAGDFLGKGKQGSKPAGKPAGGAAGKLGKIGTIGKIGGAALAVAGGAYTAYSGFSEASDEQESQLADIEAKKKSGELTSDQAAAMTKQVNEQATEKKGGAIGKGTGMAAGGLAGMKLGAALGSFAGPVGTVVGGVAGGALGAFAGSSLGEKAGELGGKVVNFFSGDKKQEVAPINTTTGAAGVPIQPEGPINVAAGAAGFPVQPANKPVATKDAELKKPEGKKEDFSKDYTKDPKYQEALKKEQDIILGRKTKAGFEDPTLSASDKREAERYAKDSYLSKADSRVKDTPNVQPVKRPGSELGNLSLEYNDQMRETAQSKPSPAPLIMNNSSSNNSTSYVPMKSTPRPEYTGSALDRYQSRISTY